MTLKEPAKMEAIVKTERLTLDNVEKAFEYQSWSPEQIKAGQVVRAALVEAAKAILNNVPESPLRTRALNNLVDARMLANASITFMGQF
jgi:hypothetical protein